MRLLSFAILLCMAVQPARADGPAAADTRLDISPTAPRQTLPAEQQSFEVDEKMPTHDFGHGRQPYLLIELPPFQAPYEVRLRNEVREMEATSSKQLTRLVPHVQTLRSDFALARNYPSTKLRERNGSQELTVFVNPQNRDERFLLVFGDMKARATELLRSESKTVFVGTGFFLDGADNRQVIHPFEKGSVLVEVKNLTPQAK
jgi:hypothetical protein